MNISNTNKHFFPNLYTCINYTFPMNPVKFPQDQIQIGRLIAIFVCSNWQNIWKWCPSGWISQTPMNISSRFFTHKLTTIHPWILWSFVRIQFIKADDRHFCLLKLTKYLKILSLQMNISNTNEYCFPILYTCIYYNPPMNPYNLQQSFYPLGDTIALAIYLFILHLNLSTRRNIYLIMQATQINSPMAEMYSYMTLNHFS